MTDLATLGISVDSRQVKDAVQELDNLTAAGKRTEGAVNKLGVSTTQAGAKIQPATKQAADYTSRMQQMGAASRITGTELLGMANATRAVTSATQPASASITAMTGKLGVAKVATSALSMTTSLLTGLIAGAFTAAIMGAVAVVGAWITRKREAAKAALELADALHQERLATEAGLSSVVRSIQLSIQDTAAKRNRAAATRDAAAAELQLARAQQTRAQSALASGAGGKGGMEAFGGQAALAGSRVRRLEPIVGKLSAGVEEADAKRRLLQGQLALQMLQDRTGKTIKFSQATDELTKRLGAGTISLDDFTKGMLKSSRGSNDGAGATARLGGATSQGAVATGGHTRALKVHAEALTDDQKALIKATEAAQDYIDSLTKETGAIGKSAVELKRMEVATAAAKAPTDALRQSIIDAGGAWEAATKAQEAAAKAIVDAEQATAAAAERQVAQAQSVLDGFNAIAEQASVTGQIMADAFGPVGDVLGGLVTSLAEYSAAKAALADDVRNKTIEQATADKALATLGAKNTAQAISGVKSLFREKSAGYKVMQAIEMAYAAFQMVNTIRSIAMDATKTASSVANSGVRASADGVAAIAKAIASLPFPMNLVAGAATAAALVAFGVKMFGGGGGGSSGPTVPTSEDIQAGNGAGSVLGDAAAKSNSIANSLEIVAANTNRDLEYSNQMLKALRSIDFGIAKLAGTIAQQIQLAGSMFDTSKLGIGTTGKGGFLGIGASTTTKALWDLGLDLKSSSVADIIANGIAGTTYQTVQKVKTKKGFFGIGGGTKTSYSTTTGSIDGEIAAAISDVLASLRDGIISAADVVGLQGAKAILDSFQVSIGKISFKDMTGEQIEEQLNAIFSSVGDGMAGAVFPALSALQKVGEGLFETFMRVAREYEVVDIALLSIGKTFGMVGLESVAARDHLVQLFGTLDEFVEATDFFRDQFLTETEQMAPIISSVRAEMVRLGLAGVTTRDQFKTTVMGLDLTTTAGAEMYAALLAVAPAFDKTLDYFEKANKATIDGLKTTADQFSKFAESLRKYRDTLFAGETGQGDLYRTLRAKFVATAALAASGDAGALGGLESSGKAFLDAAKNNASTLLQYLRDVALVAQGVDQGIFAAESVADYAQLQLDALNHSVSILGEINSGIGTIAGAVTGSGPSQRLPTPVPGSPEPFGSSTGSGSDGNEIVTELQALRRENFTIGLRMVDLTSTMTRLLTRFDGDGMPVRTLDGDSVATTTVA